MIEEKARGDGTVDGILGRVTASERNIDRDWVHDKFDDDTRGALRRGNFDYGDRRDSPELESASTGSKLRVDNLHYDLTEEDLEDLFTRIGPVSNIAIRYDRAGRSTGVAFVTYEALGSAKTAIREFDGANANGQPIHLTLLTAPSASSSSSARGARNPFDTARAPPRSLFERVSGAPIRADYDDTDGSLSPDRSHRRAHLSRPAPEHIDRYVPGQGGEGRGEGRGPRSVRRGGNNEGRRPGARRENGERDRDRRDSGRNVARDGRPRKTQEELDAEMDDYWGAGGSGGGNGNGELAKATNGNVALAAETVAPVAPAAVAPAGDEDIDMIE
ncbi:MAG: hypothetical protein M1838_002332 [Thelocarpon superellum]|nr:MAG: hypothetical protein M1838_002332 [Thelocarpon superellum]